MTMFGAAAAIGSCISAYLTEIHQPWTAYGICAVFSILMAISGAMTDMQLETNEHAQN
jgi:hypothetical protein